MKTEVLEIPFLEIPAAPSQRRCSQIGNLCWGGPLCSHSFSSLLIGNRKEKVFPVLLTMESSQMNNVC